ncbi:DUF917 domain-containing protein [Amycolatopsis jejuensis]|uniref:DUF917 domain-containing protein n=1 Tax=Amycolatopsis jejuensis TaxID=330084 RepID=UPI000526C09E|nr:DUF917 domain-containing protein [Amycolatopsis jejuensis]
MKTIEPQHVDDLALGAVVLGTGGGGDPGIAKLMLRQALDRHGPVPVVAAGELDPDGLVVPVAMVGAPTAGAEQIPNGGEAAIVLRALEGRLQRRAAAIMPVEVGGMNSLLPIAAAAELGLPVVDADLMQRAFPQIEMTTLSLDGIPASPFALCDVRGNQVLLDAVDNRAAERLVRATVAQMGMTALAGAYPHTAKQCAQSAIPGSLSYCREIGKRVRAIGESEPGAYGEFLEFCRATIVFSGKVVDLERTATGGWTRGTVVLDHLTEPGRQCTVHVQNENLAAFENGVPRVTVPDLISLLDIETGTPMTTDGLAYGQRLHVIAMPAHERWRTPDGLALAGPRAFGYDFGYTPLEAAR